MANTSLICKKFGKRAQQANTEMHKLRENAARYTRNEFIAEYLSISTQFKTIVAATRGFRVMVMMGQQYQIIDTKNKKPHSDLMSADHLVLAAQKTPLASLFSQIEIAWSYSTVSSENLFRKNVMSKAWQIAREAAARFGGKSKEYFPEALKMAWAESKG